MWKTLFIFFSNITGNNEFAPFWKEMFVHLVFIETFINSWVIMYGYLDAIYLLLFLFYLTILKVEIYAWHISFHSTSLV